MSKPSNMFQDFKTDDHRLLIPENFLVRLTKQLQLKAKTTSFDKIAAFVKRYHNSFLDKIDESLYVKFLGGRGLGASSIERALKGGKGAQKVNKDIEVKYELLDLLCMAGWEHSLRNCFDRYFTIDQKIKTVYSVDIPIYVFDLPNEPTLSLSTEEIKLRKSKIIEVLDINYWDLLKSNTNGYKTKLLPRYYTHTDSVLISKAVASKDFIAAPNDILQTLDIDGHEDEKSINEILDIGISNNFSLVKILGEGGTGKTTFLYWVAYTLCEQFNFLFLKSITTDTLIELEYFSAELVKNNKNPFVIVIDNVAQADVEVLRNIFYEIRESLSVVRPYTILIAERISRYNFTILNEKLERYFSGSIQTISYIPVDKEIIFDKFYSSLITEYPQMNNQNQKSFSKNVFLDKSVVSISESIFRLLKELEINKTIDYDFDWDDWYALVKRKDLPQLKNLFVAVACFYQFGIKLPINFSHPDLRYMDRLQVIEAIHSFETNYSPIILTDDNSFLALKHEHVASWFFSYEKNKALAQVFFKDFLKHIENEPNAKLIRQIRKILEFKEFKNSCLSAEISFASYDNIISHYLEITTISDDEKQRMLNEKGMILMKTGKEEDAVKIFEFIADNYPANNHARDQLAKFYSQSSHTYQLAVNRYSEIIENGGLYACVAFKTLLKRSLEEGIDIQVKVNTNLSINIQHKLLYEYILNNEIELAEELLKQISIISDKTAEAYYRIARALPYAENTIEKKRAYFLKAIKLNNRASRFTQYLTFQIEYAVFLFRIREFPRSTDYTQNILSVIKSPQKEYFYNSYYQKVINTIKLFFPKLPERANSGRFEQFMSDQCSQATPLINVNQENAVNVLKGFLILQTVKYHVTPMQHDIFCNVRLLLAYYHTKHSAKAIGCIQPREHRIRAENYYDRVIHIGGRLTQNQYFDMINNLINFQEIPKARKALLITNALLKQPENQEVSKFFRLRGNIYNILGKYSEAMKNYEMAFRFCTISHFEKPYDFRIEKSYLLNNAARLICKALQSGKPLLIYNLAIARNYCNLIPKYNPKFHYLSETYALIDSLENNTTKKFTKLYIVRD